MAAPVDLPGSREEVYRRTTDPAHRKALGQYFTPPAVARFLCAWACRGAATVLDPAAGNSVLLCQARRVAPDAALTGYEVDEAVLAFFGNPAEAQLHRQDYLAADWQRQYDAIVCNPPYLRFQAIADRTGLLERFRAHTGVRYSRYTNLSVLFLIKSLCQLAPGGRLAYILPAEFLNARYGTPVKELLVRRRLLRAVINFPHDRELFPDAITTCCLLLVDREPKDGVAFYRVDSMEQLADLPVETLGRDAPVRVPWQGLDPGEKWRRYLWQEPPAAYAHLTRVERFCTVSRGIATGANGYFCFNRSRMAAEGLDPSCFSRCVCRSASVETPLFTGADFDELARRDRTVFLLDLKGPVSGAAAAYLEKGAALGIPQKYLPSIRHPWYAMEQKPPAPIWMTSASRGRIKFVRNLAGARALTTFHLVYLRPEWEALTDLLFCYFLTPIAQELLGRNRKALGNGLQKFQPRDFQEAPMLDVTVLSDADRRQVQTLYNALARGADPAGVVARLNPLFARYLMP